jgi:Tfp pilus assembly protein PilX
MKVQLKQRTTPQGSVLIVTLFITVLFGLFLFSYLYLVRTQKVTVVRAQSWNGALGVAEAGIEEALAQLNPGAPLPSINRAANGWGGPANGIYGPVTRTLPYGTYTAIITTDTMPIVYSTGTVTVASIPAILTRVLMVTTTNVPMFSVGMAAIDNINFNGHNVGTDSFNSANTNLSTNGRYDSTKTSTNGTIASVSGVVNVGNANVNGSVLLGPGATDAIKNNGVITGGVSNDFNVDFPDVVLPSVSPTPAVSLPQIINLITYQYVFATSGYYSINNLTGSVYVAPGVQVTLLLTGNASPSSIEVGATNSVSGQLTIYMDGPSFSLSGQSTVDGGVAANLSYLGTTNNTSISLSGNASFTGTIYAPEASFSLGGGGNNTYDFVGACVTKTVTMNGHFNFHYDENLAVAGPSKGYVATSWKEL